jgi:hypothetical protein
MRGVVAWLLLTAALVAFAPSAEANKAAKKQKLSAAQQARQAGRDRSAEQWHARDAAQLPFGSSIWWDQMLRENRLTCCN